jgi:hypothetical protein
MQVSSVSGFRVSSAAGFDRLLFAMNSLRKPKKKRAGATALGWPKFHPLRVDGTPVENCQQGDPGLKLEIWQMPGEGGSCCDQR